MKSIFASKTVLVNAIIALSALYPPAAAWVQAHAALTLELLTYANILLRLVTHKGVSLFGDSK